MDHRRHGAQLVEAAPRGHRLAGGAAGLVVVPGPVGRHRQHAERRRLAEIALERQRQLLEIVASGERVARQMASVERTAPRPLDGVAQ